MDSIINEVSTGGVSPAIDQQTLADKGFSWRERDGVKVLICRPLEEAGFINGFSTRLGGVSPFPDGDLNLAGYDDDSAENIEENRRRFMQVIGDGLRLTSVWQVHSDKVKLIRTAGDVKNTNERADALISDLAGVLTGVKTADCVPVLIADPANEAYAAVHAGWRGTASEITSKTVRKMSEVYGSRPADLLAAIGPAATCRNYEVGAEVIDAFSGISNSGRYFSATRDGHAMVDLIAANRDQLTNNGLSRDKIFITPFCTMEHTDLFFSYRIEKKKHGRTGRLLSVIGRR